MTEEMQALCCALAAARAQGTTVPAPGFEFSLADAYAMQSQVTALMNAKQVGWKVGSTSEAAQARLGTNEPGAGALLEPFVFASGEQVPIFTAHHVHVEVEFAFRMADSLTPRERPYDENAVRRAVGGFIPAMELVGSRFAAGLDGSGRNLVTADGGANIAFVGGNEVPVAPERDYRAHRCTLAINDRQVAAGTGALALGDPIHVLTWLANHLSRRGLTLEAGAVVTTGTCTGLIAVSPLDRLAVDFADLGVVRVELVTGGA